jgi:hypothetical protein
MSTSYTPLTTDHLLEIEIRCHVQEYLLQPGEEPDLGEIMNIFYETHSDIEALQFEESSKDRVMVDVSMYLKERESTKRSHDGKQHGMER